MEYSGTPFFMSICYFLYERCCIFLFQPFLSFLRFCFQDRTFSVPKPYVFGTKTVCFWDQKRRMEIAVSTSSPFLVRVFLWLFSPFRILGGKLYWVCWEPFSDEGTFVCHWRYLRRFTKTPSSPAEGIFIKRGCLTAGYHAPPPSRSFYSSPIFSRNPFPARVYNIIRSRSFPPID